MNRHRPLPFFVDGVEWRLLSTKQLQIQFALHVVELFRFHIHLPSSTCVEALCCVYSTHVQLIVLLGAEQNQTVLFQYVSFLHITSFVKQHCVSVFSSMLMLQIELAFVDAILPHATSLSFTHFASYQPYTFLPISAIHPPHLPSPNLS